MMIETKEKYKNFIVAEWTEGLPDGENLRYWYTKDWQTGGVKPTSAKVRFWESENLDIALETISERYPCAFCVIFDKSSIERIIEDNKKDGENYDRWSKIYEQINDDCIYVVDSNICPRGAFYLKGEIEDVRYKCFMQWINYETDRGKICRRLTAAETDKVLAAGLVAGRRFVVEGEYQAAPEVFDLESNIFISEEGVLYGKGDFEELNDKEAAERLVEGIKFNSSYDLPATKEATCCILDNYMPA